MTVRRISFCLLFLAVTAVAAPLYAACYSCSLTSQGIPYCKTSTSGYQSCRAGVKECSTADKCGSGGGLEVYEPMALNDCAAPRLVLTAVELPNAQPQPRLVLASAELPAVRSAR